MSDEYQILGTGQEALSMILEILAVSGTYSNKVVIIPNMPFIEDESMPFRNHAIDCQVVEASDYLWESKEKRCILGAMGSLKQNSKRQIYQWFLDNYFIREENYVNIIHPDTTISTTSQLSQGVHIEPGVVIAPYVELGFGVSINRCAFIGHHTKIDKFTTVNPGANIASSVKIGKNCIIGSQSFISDHVIIGDGSIIGAGSIVLKDIPGNVLAYGNPCRVVRSL